MRQDFITIPLTQGKRALISVADAERVLAHRWYALKVGGRSRGWYVRSRINGRNVYLHRFIAGSTAPSIDHRNGNGLDNRRKNLRPCTQSQNGANTSRKKTVTSGFRGVYPCGKGWCAKIMQHRKSVHLGVFRDPVDAAYAYDDAASERFGEFARLNFP